MSAPPPTLRVPRAEYERGTAAPYRGENWSRLTEAERLRHTDRIAGWVLRDYLRRHRLPPQIEVDDASAIARAAAWRAGEAWSETGGASWASWVITQTGHSIAEIWRRRCYGAANRYAGGRRLETVPLYAVIPGTGDLQYGDALPDPRDHYAPVEARWLVSLVKKRIKPRRWRALSETVCGGKTLREWGAGEGIGESRAHQLVSEARKAAREALSL